MKKRILILFIMCLFTKLFGQNLEFIIKKELQISDYFHTNNYTYLKGNALYANEKIGISYIKNEAEIALFDKINNITLDFPVESLMLKNNKNLLPNQYKTDIWIPQYNYNQLLQNNRNKLMFENEKFWDKWKVNACDVETWRDDFSVQRFVLGDYFIHVAINTVAWEDVNFIGYLEEMTEKQFIYDVHIMSTNYSQYIGKGQSYHPEFQFLFEKLTPFKIIFIIDGDFLKMYIDEISEKTLFKTLAKATPEACKQIEEWIAEKSDNLSAVVWPHHADGTSEYEDTIRYPDPIVIEESEVIEVEEYVDETENSNNQSEKQQTRLEWLKENDPERYELEMYEIECMHKRERREKILKIVIPSSIVFVVFGIIFIILKKKKKSAK